MKQLGNWFIRSNEGNIEIISEKYPYVEVQKAILQMYYATEVSGDDVIRITDDSNLLRICFKGSSIRLLRKDDNNLYCGEISIADVAIGGHLRAHITGVLNDLRVKLFCKKGVKSIYLHNENENEELAPKYWKTFGFVHCVEKFMFELIK